MKVLNNPQIKQPAVAGMREEGLLMKVLTNIPKIEFDLKSQAPELDQSKFIYTFSGYGQFLSCSLKHVGRVPVCGDGSTSFLQSYLKRSIGGPMMVREIFEAKSNINDFPTFK